MRKAEQLHALLLANLHFMHNEQNISKQSLPKNEMKFVSYNIQYGTCKDGRIDLNRITAKVGDADVIALQGVDRLTQKHICRIK